MSGLTLKLSCPANGGIATRSRTADAHAASSRPAIPPISASTRLSVSSWRTSRPRVAPSDNRMPISFRRAADLASSRLATFAQAMSSTRPTAPITKITTGVALFSTLGGRNVALANNTPDFFSSG